ncbi:MAG: ribosome small subunit-dependent GTPase A [Vampirovibrionales bacterium]|nr:ribosome small subunit-dependent GTPase A [Vampirovibrionales bacterium]
MNVSAAWVIAIEGHRHRVLWQAAPDAARQTLDCAVKGVFKKSGERICVGDWVLLGDIDATNGTARIDGLQPEARKTLLEKPRIANVTQVLITLACDSPPLSLETLDRLLSHTLCAGLRPVLLLTKTDLIPHVNDPELHSRLEHIDAFYHAQLGIPVFKLCNKPGAANPNALQQELLRLNEQLKGHVSVLAGPSGVGKSSLLNLLLPGAELRIGEVSQKLQRGTHTTRHVALLPLEPVLPKGTALSPEQNLQKMQAKGWIADTPGFSQMHFEQTPPDALLKSFPELLQAGQACLFDDCRHALSEQTCSFNSETPETPEANTSELPVDERPGPAQAVPPWRLTHYRAFLEEAQKGEQQREARSQKAEQGQRIRHGAQGAQQQTGLGLKLEKHLRQAARNTQRQQVGKTANAEVLDELNT